MGDGLPQATFFISWSVLDFFSAFYHVTPTQLFYRPLGRRARIPMVFMVPRLGTKLILQIDESMSHRKIRKHLLTRQKALSSNMSQALITVYK